MKAIMFSVVEAKVAATGPTGVANQIHQIVAAFHKANVNAAHPNMRRHPRREASQSELIHNSGVRATGSVRPESESQPPDRRRTEAMTAAILRDMRAEVVGCKDNI